jgi:hypothetical protein
MSKGVDDLRPVGAITFRGEEVRDAVRIAHGCDLDSVNGVIEYWRRMGRVESEGSRALDTEE